MVLLEIIDIVTKLLDYAFGAVVMLL